MALDIWIVQYFYDGQVATMEVFAANEADAKARAAQAFASIAPGAKIISAKKKEE